MDIAIGADAASWSNGQSGAGGRNDHPLKSSDRRFFPQSKKRIDRKCTIFRRKLLKKLPFLAKKRSKYVYLAIRV